MGGMIPMVEPVRLIAAVLPLLWFVRQDLARWKVRDSVLATMLAMIPVACGLDLVSGGPWHQAFVGAGVFLAVSLAIREAAYRATGIDSFGAADVVLAGFAGAFLGWQAILVWLFLGSVLGIAHWTLMTWLRRRKGRRPRRRVPAGPAFAAAQLLLMILQAFGLYSGFPFVVA